MNILVVSVSAPPKSGPESIQVYKYLKYLAPKTSIEVVTTEVENKGWNSADKSIIPPQEIKFLRIQLYKNYLIQRISQKLTTNNYPDVFSKFHNKSDQIKNDLSIKPDIIYSRAIPHSSSILALKLKKAFNVPWVMHLSDPWIGNPYKKYNDKELEYCIEQEKECFKYADKISLTSQITIDYYVNKYPKYKNKFVLFPNIYDDKDVSDKRPINFDGKLRITHTGNFYGKRNPKFLLNALIKLNAKNLLDNVEITFAGNIDEDSLHLIEKANLSQLKYIGHVSSSESIKLQGNADVLLVIDKPFETTIDNCFLPSKVIDYMVARKYILGITNKNSSTHSFVENKYGKCFDYDQEELLEKHLINLINAYNKKESAIFNISEVDFSYSASKNADRLVELFNEIK